MQSPSPLKPKEKGFCFHIICQSSLETVVLLSLLFILFALVTSQYMTRTKPWRESIFLPKENSPDFETFLPSIKGHKRHESFHKMKISQKPDQIVPSFILCFPFHQR